jgi:exodeoxyribonuclease VII large subunit
MAGSFWDFQQNMAKGRRTGESGAPVRPHAGRSDKPLTVSQLTQRIDKAIRGGVPAKVCVRGEVSNFKLHGSSGHAYFTLKDPGACIDCVMWRDDAAGLRFEPTDGLELIATGGVRVFAQKGRYQLYVSTLVPLGQGALELARQQIQAKLAAEGLFDADRKKPLPRYPRHIVLVTSSQTAAVADMLKVLRRFPFLHVRVYHVPVQGDGSAERIAEALAHLRRVKDPIDLVLLGRGGGSLEDLWEFNEEVVARAIAASRVPVITGIGHEIDVSIADLVADHHAHTPTEAAQVATAHWRGARELIDSSATRLARELRTILRHARQRLGEIERHEVFRRPLDRVNQLRQVLDERERLLTQVTAERLRRAGDRVAGMDVRLRERHPRHRLMLEQQRVAGLADRLTRAAAQAVAVQCRRIDLLGARLHAINPAEVLKRGYSLTTSKKSGQVIRDPSEVKPGDLLVTRLANGQIESRVEDARQLRLFE